MRPLITRPNLTAWRGLAIAAAVLLLAPASGAAQRLAPELARAPDPWAEAAASPQIAAAAFGHPDDHRWEGMLVGAIGLGLLGAFAGHEFCRFAENAPSNNCTLPTVLGMLGGAFVGGITGGLFGGLIPKAKP